MTGVSERLDAIEARLSAATPGPWFQHQDWIDMGVPDASHTISNDPKPYGKFIASVGLHYDVKHGNANLIAHAPQDITDLLDLARKQQAAIDAVTALHKPEKRWMPYEGAGVSFDAEREAMEAMDDVDLNSVALKDIAENGTPYFEVCAECKHIEDSPCEGECTLETGYRESIWPCRTIQALEGK